MPGSVPLHETALALLSRRSLTRRELVGRLVSKGCARDEATAEAERLAQSGIVDERTLAYNLARRRSEEGRLGRSRVRAELIRRGVPAALADATLDEVFGGGDGGGDAVRLEQALARALRGRPLPADRPGRDRIVRRLVRAGFPAGQVLQLLARHGDGFDPFPGAEDDDSHADDID